MNSFARQSAKLMVLIEPTASIVTAQKGKPEEIIARHLESIGTAQARAVVRSQGAVLNEFAFNRAVDEKSFDFEAK